VSRDDLFEDWPQRLFIAVAGALAGWSAGNALWLIAWVIVHAVKR